MFRHPFFLRFCYPINTRKKVPPIKTVIYLDVLLLTNFALTLLFLLAAGLLAGVECRAGRLLLGGRRGQLPRWPCWPRKRRTLPRSYIKCQPLPSRWPLPTAGRGSRCFARLVGWFCAGNLLLAGALLLPGAQTNNGCIYLPLSPGALLAGAGGVVLAVQGVLRFLGRGRDRYSPPGSPWQTQRWMSGPSVTPAFRCRSRFRAGRWCWCGSVPCRAACRPPWILIWSSTLPGPLPCPSRRWGCALFPAPPWPGTVSCRPSRPACAAPAPPRAGQGRAPLCRLCRPPPAA